MKKSCIAQTTLRRILIFSAILALAGLFSSSQPDAEIYRWVDENGVKHYSNSPPSDAENAEIVFGEYRYDEAADQKRTKSDQKTIDGLTGEINTEKQQAQMEKQNKLLEKEQKKFEEAKNNQPILFASECFSPSYSIQQGRGKFEAVIPRELMESEHRNLQELFQSLDGEWEGNAMVFVCEETQGEVRKVVDNCSVKSEVKMRSRGQFDLEATFYSLKKRESHQESIRLYLDPKKLASKPDISISDIELISVSSDELVYVENEQDRSGSGALLVRESVVTIRKTGKASFLFERINYYNGMLETVTTCNLKNN